VAAKMATKPEGRMLSKHTNLLPHLALKSAATANATVAASKAMYGKITGS